MANMEESHVNLQEQARQWAESRLINLEETDEFDKDLSELTGSRYRQDVKKFYKKISRLDSYNQAKIIEMMFQSRGRANFNASMGVEDSYGLLFAGPAGSGKMTTATHLIGNLKEFDYTRLIMLTGIKFGRQSLQKAVARMDAVLSLATEEQPMILVIEHLSENQYGEELYDMLADFAEAQETECFFPILIEKDADAFPAVLRRYFPLFMFSLPTLDERKDYIQRHQNVEAVSEEESLEEESDGDGEGGEPEDDEDSLNYKIVFEGITPDEIAQETEGFSYGQLKTLMEYIKLFMADMIMEDIAAGGNSWTQIQKYLEYEGHYTVRENLVRQGIQMLSYASGHSGQVIMPGAPVILQSIPQQFQNGQQYQNNQWYQNDQPGQNDGHAHGSWAGVPGQEGEALASDDAVRAAARGKRGTDIIHALGERYEKAPHQPGAFGAVNERLANGSDIQDEEDD